LALAVSVRALLLLCYLRTMRKTIESRPGTGGARLHWTPAHWLAAANPRACFSPFARSRSKQHRVIFAFFYAGVFAPVISVRCLVAAIACHSPSTSWLCLSDDVLQL